MVVNVDESIELTMENSGMSAGLETMLDTAKNISNYLVEYYYENGLLASPLRPAWDMVTSKYNYWMTLADKRVENWPLMSSPFTTVVIGIGYTLMCVLGPKLMSNHKPVNNLRPFIVAYNLFVAGLNLYIGLELLATSRLLNINWKCEPVNYSNDPVAVRIASALWWYYISKLFEMADSIFFILKKKNDQLTFLHVYHHSTMFCLWWIGVKFVAGGSSFLGAMFNCFVHVIMYIYYLIAALGPAYRKWLWWKKYLTLIQMFQFFAAMVMTVNAIQIGCAFPMWMQYTMVAYMMSFIVLFSHYFYNEYCARRKRQTSSISKKK